MKSIRMFFLSSILFSSIFTTANNTNNTLKTWQSTYLNAMTPEELQFTANFLYLSYALALVESKIKQFNTPILRLNQSIRTKIAEYKDYKEISDDLAMLKTLLDRLSYVVGARTIYIETYKMCQQQSPQYATLTIQAALESIQQDAQEQLRAWADEKASTMPEQLKKLYNDIGQSTQYFPEILRTYYGMSEGILPVEITEENEKDRSLIMFNILLNNTPLAITLTENLASMFHESYDDVAQIITVGAEVYKKYYAVIHYLIMSPTFDQQYTTTMFGMHDILPQEYRTLLPQADNVFSHMLETTKLYTQSEFVQQQ